MVRTLLVRGMLVGAAAGLVAVAFASLFGEPQIDSAIAVETAGRAQVGGEHELVSRSIQSTLGLTVAVVMYGAALGGIFGLAFAFVYGRVGALTARGTSVLVAAAGFVALFLVPFLKYPANPPAAGSPDTIGRRSVLYVVMVGICVLAAIAAAMTGKTLAARLGGWNAALVAIGAFLAVVAVASIALPGIDEVAADFPATLLWRFRLASVGTQLALWTTIGLLFGALTERGLRRHTAASQVASAG
jgi:hypothetical protein